MAVSTYSNEEWLEGHYGVMKHEALRWVPCKSGQLCPIIRNSDGGLDVLAPRGLMFESGLSSLCCDSWSDALDRIKYETCITSTE